jgi:acetamidase/formamidase
MTEHKLSAAPTHSVWDRDLEPRLRVVPGDEVQFECVDASGGQVHPAMTVEEFQQIDRTRIHALTGPVWIEGAAPGDVLQVDVLATQHRGWGWSSVIPGLGFLKERFTTPFLFHWQLDGNETRSLYPGYCLCGPFLE